MIKRDAETANRNIPVIRIFISSPGDVTGERKIALRMIESVLPKLPHFNERILLVPIAWDDPASQVPMVATETPQESVNADRPRPATCDIVIVILWSRMGTPLPDTVHKPTGEPYLSGTEWEYQDAVTSTWDPKPTVLVYRRSEEPQIGMRDPMREEKFEQFERVEAFFSRFKNADGSLSGGINEYATPDEFETMLRQHLEKLLYRRLKPSNGNDPTPPVITDIPSAYREWLERTCADVSLLGQETQESHAITLSRVYVPAMTRPSSEGSLEAQGKQQEKLAEGKEPDLVTLLQRLDENSLFVSAAAGAGKSTFCRWAVLRSIAGAETNHPVSVPEQYDEPVPVHLRGRLPLLVPLGDFAKDMDCRRGRTTWRRADLERALIAWVDASPPTGLTGDIVEAHLKAGRLFLLLDGVDEVPPSEIRDGETTYPRELLLSGLGDALPEWNAIGNRILITSRPYGLDEARLRRLGVDRTSIEPLPNSLQDLFVTRWFHTLGKEALAANLIETIRARDELAPLVENPMLLTALCVLHDSGGRLPEDRYELYKRIVNNVLHHRYSGDARQREPVRARLEAVALGMHIGEPDAPRPTPAREISYLESEHWLGSFDASEGLSYEKRRVEPALRREELLNRSGLLVPLSNDRAAFYHLSFQEFLAAERILRSYDDLEPVFRERSAVAEWHLTLMFLLAGKIASRSPQWGANLLQRLITDQNRATVKNNPAPAVFLAEALDLYVAKQYPIPEALAGDFRRLTMDAIEDEVEVQARQTLGLCLGRLGDPRIFDLRDPGAYVEVSAGRYPIGENGAPVEIPATFFISRFPVTNGQYQAFIDDGGYQYREHWSDLGWAWKEKSNVTEPSLWHGRQFNGATQPVVGVSFWEAEACSKWAGGRLPTEDEWGAAARGPTGYAYPWSNDWQKGICNTTEISLGMTSVVGLFPLSRQANFGVEDLAGNVWEWSSSFRSVSSFEHPDSSRVLRGGSWFGDQGNARCTYRHWYFPGYRSAYFGFRVVCSASSQGTDT